VTIRVRLERFPLPPQQAKHELAAPMTFEPQMLDEMSFLSETKAPEQQRRPMVFGVRGCRDTMLAESAEYELNHATKRLGRVAASLMAGSEGHAKFHLPRVVQPAMQTAITHHDSACLLDDGELQPCPRNAWLHFELPVDESRCVVQSVRLPGLIPGHLRQRTIPADRRSIAALQSTEDQS